ncbi:type VII secretion integral membrane protein EccD, partial [Mycobacterium sp. shizuoka-1]|uniref:type VII secretion integral membrane protein EccD n=1 Tax=Mycobacterium sp. shizuoka-1 TaxID=2039281 RepID=UPI0018EE2FD1
MASTHEMCRVCIRSADREVDCTLAAHVPIAEMVPIVVDLLGSNEFAGTEPQLARLCGEFLDPAATLAQCAIPDGEVLTLTAARPVPPDIRFDPSVTVADAVHRLASPPQSAAGRHAGRIVVCWAAAVLAALLGSRIGDPGTARHVTIGGAAAALALVGAMATRRGQRARADVAGLGALAAGFAGLTAVLACPDRSGVARFLLATSAIAAVSLLGWRLLNCAPVLFLPLAAVAMTASATTTGALAGWWPVTAVGPILVMVALTTLAVAPRLAVRSSGLSTAGLSDPELETRAEIAHHRLTAATVTGAGTAALGAAFTAATALRPVPAASFLALVGMTLMLRVRCGDSPYRSAALLVSSAVVVTAMILCAAEIPAGTPWLGGAILAAGALGAWLGSIRPVRLSAAARRVVAVVDLAVGAATV